ncbi:putative chaperone, dnaJ [Candidatus Nitrososphaera gargensis Ga9.2]|uniref:Putative chaperone, dnaJ n=1 Tax=Nitrososphaera gargensis (strain Ga9.2) TaxID=1237085 RepID=K0IGB6_NITGG|nr:putative chaperone, dnaJ [Candidatus Nitrososphaera gargensis Ga9.2]
MICPILADSKGYYAVLGVSEKASYKEIRHAYRRLARKYHPDRNNSAFAEEMIKKINAAFEVLSDETKRAQYDRSEFDSAPEPEPTYEPEPVQQPNSPEPWKMANENVVADFFNGPYFLDTPKGRFHIIVEPSLCMAFGSCETLAPKVFVVEKNKRVNPKAVVECETCADYERIHAAAATCPTKAIKIIDRYTGEQLYP